MKKIILMITLLGSVLSVSLAQKSDSTLVKEIEKSSGVAQFKLSGSAYFLKNAAINDLYKTNAFHLLSLGLEVLGKGGGVYIDVGGMRARANIDTTALGGNKIDAEFRQIMFGVGVLQRAHVGSGVALRGKLGINYLLTSEDFTLLSYSGPGFDMALGLEFQTTDTSFFFVDLHYQHNRSQDVGSLGGFRIELGLKFGSSPEKTN